MKTWKDISISKKLYAVVGVMAVLIIAELATLRFAMGTLSAVRAFVGGEGSWSKAQKNAAFSLHHYLLTHDEKDYELFLTYLTIPEGDHLARTELERPTPDLAVVRRGFLAGEIHADDIDPMVDLLRRFSWVSYLHRAIVVWADADVYLARFKEAGIACHDLLTRGTRDAQAVADIMRRIAVLNERLTHIENEFSAELGEGSRWLERVLISILCLAVTTVEGIGLTLTLLTSRAISRGLADVAGAAEAIGRGEFERTATVRSKDELGLLAQAVNGMGAMLRQSYGELEQRVRDRTAELAQAVRARDVFMSIASHELKTPLTSLKLQVQMRQRFLRAGKTDHFTIDKLHRMLADDERQITRLTRLVDDMLDISRLDTGRFVMQREAFDLCALARDGVERFFPQFQAVGCEVSTHLPEPVVGRWDYYRIEQILANLLTNAMKYGPGRPVHVSVEAVGDRARLRVQDHGMGIASADQKRIFERFERAMSSNHVSGLGLGLFIASQIAEAHGGSIVVKSEPGVGSEFVVELGV